MHRLSIGPTARALLCAALAACAGEEAALDASHAGASAAGTAAAAGQAGTGDHAGGTGTVAPDGAVLAPTDAAVSGDARHVDAHTPTPVPYTCPPDRFELTPVDVGEVTLQVACRGDGPTLVMLHGYPELHLTWSKLTPPLVQAGFRVVAPDQRGYNLSEKPSGVEAYGIDHLVADVHGLIEATGESQVVLVAHDWGGVVAWVYAHRYPDKLRGLIVISGPHPDIWGHPEVDPVQAQAANGYVPLLASPLGETSIAFVEPLISPHLTADELAAYRKAWNQPMAMTSMNNWYRANVYPDYKLPTGVLIEVPTLVVWGGQDSFATPSELDYIPDYVSNLRVKRFEQVDHWVTHQVTDELVQEITDFVGSL